MITNMGELRWAEKSSVGLFLAQSERKRTVRNTVHKKRFLENAGFEG